MWMISTLLETAIEGCAIIQKINKREGQSQIAVAALKLEMIRCESREGRTIWNSESCSVAGWNSESEAMTQERDKHAE
eukprot:180175-Hanusia_phi.AAC.1